MIGNLSRSVFLTTSAPEAYSRCLSLWDVVEPIEHSVALRWSTRWGFTHIDGRAHFIPAQGGCVMYLSLTGASALSRLLLWVLRPVQRSLWRPVEEFRCDVEQPAELEATTAA